MSFIHTICKYLTIITIFSGSGSPYLQYCLLTIRTMKYAFVRLCNCGVVCARVLKYIRRCANIRPVYVYTAARRCKSESTATTMQCVRTWAAAQSWCSFFRFYLSMPRFIAYTAHACTHTHTHIYHTCIYI